MSFLVTKKEKLYRILSMVFAVYHIYSETFKNITFKKFMWNSKTRFKLKCRLSKWNWKRRVRTVEKHLAGWDHRMNDNLLNSLFIIIICQAFFSPMAEIDWQGHYEYFIPTRVFLNTWSEVADWLLPSLERSGKEALACISFELTCGSGAWVRTTATVLVCPANVWIQALVRTSQTFKHNY